ncbi:recombination regulator RecX [Acinetobacter baumannii]|uniref:regulatory protein RecX n=1 Tax=Acinetobacter baumannii TaxID=470 RepID=UPI0002CF6264|nr:regulatory protein RecX [Acinetobacter baumannii]ENW51623.1 regulatory protein recX [Acinetobacter baumannii NIPH 67]MDC4322457.1 recombination regulator RecX [Acinetobacter baumannii]MDC4833933.1 recombination regulator RecX [Acinetobacter baumannii]MDK2185159.1 regulatory protein RecX [Acinetobacter baumannii]MDK2257968.1 regulatory protein RecX [Acinetobacter baumannii]
MFKRNDEQSQQRPPLTGQRLRSYAFALLTRRDYSKAELIEKLARYAQNIEEVKQLVEVLSEQNYQSDQRVAEQMLASQIRKGKGPKRIQQALKIKQIENDLIADEIQEIDWVEQAYQLKVKKFGEAVEKDPKLKAKQIRFLQYRGFDLDVILKAIQRKLD